MEMRNYSLQNNDGTQERDKIQKVANGRKVPQTAGKKFLSEFFADDIHSIKDYILWDVLLPAVKNAISDTLTNGIDMLLFGQTRSRSTNSVVRRITPYSSIYSNHSNSILKYDNYQAQQAQKVSGRSLSGYSYQEVAMATRPEAEDVLAQLRINLDKYGVVSVSDLYDAVGEIPDMQDNKWGWTDLSGAYIQRCSDGFLIKMPRVEAL